MKVNWYHLNKREKVNKVVYNSTWVQIKDFITFNIQYMFVDSQHQYLEYEVE